MALPRIISSLLEELNVVSIELDRSSAKIVRGKRAVLIMEMETDEGQAFFLYWSFPARSDGPTHSPQTVLDETAVARLVKPYLK